MTILDKLRRAWRILRGPRFEWRTCGTCDGKGAIVWPVDLTWRVCAECDGEGARKHWPGLRSRPRRTARGKGLMRSSRPDVRNPVLRLPAARRLCALPESQRAALAAVLRDLAADARERAEKSWRTHKAPMAAYWKAVSVYAGHLARALR